jgi:hypothetical protein
MSAQLQLSRMREACNMPSAPQRTRTDNGVRNQRLPAAYEYGGQKFKSPGE